jgi:hypothetical protein
MDTFDVSGAAVENSFIDEVFDEGLVLNDDEEDLQDVLNNIFNLTLLMNNPISPIYADPPEISNPPISLALLQPIPSALLQPIPLVQPTLPIIQNDISSNVFQLGRMIHVRPRPNPRSRRHHHVDDSDSKEEGEVNPDIFQPYDWTTRLSRPVEIGRIRLLDNPVPETPVGLHHWWTRDRTLKEWNDELRAYENDVSGNVIARAMGAMSHVDEIKAVFAANQRKRWLARVTFNRWTQWMWRKKTQCNVDLIEMEPVSDHDAVFLTDTIHHQIYRFHRHDVFNNLISNLSMADEFMPTPRAPTNPWTNAPLSEHQIIGLCTQLVSDYGRRGRCPPVLFAAFCASRYNLRRFQREHASLLAQQAIMNYFKDLNDQTMDTVFDTIYQLMHEADLDASPVAVRRFLREGSQTKYHRAWLNLARDYTLYINLHIQVRPGWHDEPSIYADVRHLYSLTPFPDPVSVRVRQIRTALQTHASNPVLGQNLGLPVFLRPPVPRSDISGNSIMEMNLALQLIQQALFRH